MLHNFLSSDKYIKKRYSEHSVASICWLYPAVSQLMLHSQWKYIQRLNAVSKINNSLNKITECQSTQGRIPLEQ